MTIHCMLQGGLGNQLFQYACAKMLQIELKSDEKIRIYRGAYKNDELRDFSLSNLKLIDNIKIEEDYFPQYIDEYHNLKFRILRKVLNNKILFSVYRRKNAYFWFDSAYQKIDIYDKNRDVYISGYWQSPDYFKNIRKILIEEIKPLKISAELDLFYYDKINDSEKSVCIHIRRGDFVKLKKHFVCTPKYYHDSIKIIQEKVINARFFVFSDDMSWVKDNIILPENTIYVEGVSNDCIEMYLMSLCENFIISNSSFSWWAQYLSDAKIIIAPERWYSTNEQCELYSDKWLIVNTI